MAYAIVVLGLAACLVGSFACLAPVIYAIVTGRFIEGPHQDLVAIREQPMRFVRIAFLGIFIGGWCLVGLVAMIRAALKVVA